MKNSELARLRNGLVSKANGVVLEIGFGSGLNLPYYKNTSILYALEPSQEVFNIAKENINRAKFAIEHLKSSAEQIPLQDKSIDSAISTWSLCSVTDPERALREVRRILKPEGKFYFLEHGKSSKTFKTKLQDIMNPFSKCLLGGCNLNRNIEKLIIGNGFEIENIEKFDLKSKPLACMYRGTARINTHWKCQNDILKTDKQAL